MAGLPNVDSNQLVIATEWLTKRFGDFTAVDAVNLQVRRGEIFGLLGPNGSGKTTTIRMLLGLLAPSEGAVQIFGIPMQTEAERVRMRLGYMSQRFSLYNDLSVWENLRFHGRVYGLEGSALTAAIEGALRLADLEGQGHLRTGTLSGGWRQRLALSAAILHGPELLILDEPTAGVDPFSRRTFWDLLYTLTARGTTIFVTTHYMDEAEHCHRLAFIQHGRIAALGTPRELIAAPQVGQVLEVVPQDAVEAVKVLRQAMVDQRLEIGEVSLFGSMVHVFAADVELIQEKVLIELGRAGIRVEAMAIISPSLEDVFIASMR